MGKPAAMDGWIVMSYDRFKLIHLVALEISIDRTCTQVLLLADTNQQKSNLEIMHDLDPAARSAGSPGGDPGGSEILEFR